MILTYKLKHNRDFSDELRKAKQVAEFGIKNRTLSSKDVKQFGLKSAISNQILRKYVKNKKVKSVSSVQLTIPNQGIKVDKKSKKITIPCLELVLNYQFPDFEKINQIEIGKEYACVSVTIPDIEPGNVDNYIGVDRNTTGHIAVAANPKTGKIWKLGKSGLHIHKKYSNIRRTLQKQGKYKKVKQIKDKESRIVKDLNHHLQMLESFELGTEKSEHHDKMVRIYGMAIDILKRQLLHAKAVELALLCLSYLSRAH